jgi:uncharacterized membrane protein
MVLKSEKKLMLNDHLMVSEATEMQNLGGLKQIFSNIVRFWNKFFSCLFKIYSWQHRTNINYQNNERVIPAVYYDQRRGFFERQKI